MKILNKSDNIPNDFMSASEKYFQGNMETHLHTFFELEYVIEGQGICEIDGVCHEMRPNMLFFLTPVNVHTVKNADVRLINVMFQSESHAELFPFSLQERAHTPMLALSEQDGVLIRALLSEIVQVHRSDRNFATSLMQCVMQKISAVSNLEKDSPLPYIRRAILFIHENFQNGITLEQTAAYLGLTASYFSDYFQKQVGQNFKAYLDEIRFSHAKNLLFFSDLSIGEICRRSGFSDYANFARRFRQRFGCSMRVYREEHAEYAGDFEQ